jgi:hypothetical protein
VGLGRVNTDVTAVTAAEELRALAEETKAIVAAEMPSRRGEALVAWPGS